MVSKRTKYLIAAAAAATVLYSSSLNASTVKAEGTRNMVSNGGYRPYTWATDTTTAGITRRTILKVYAKAGEKIYLGSSVYANSQDIIVKDPSGVQTTCDVLQSGKGYIDDTIKEAAGPLPNANGYTPYIIDVNQTGIWQVEFKGDESKTANPTFQPASYDFKSTQSGTVASWDITVRDGSGNEKTGRVFTSYISILMGNNLADNTKKVLSSDFYVLTKDGYVYKTGMNGIDPNGFMFFSNNRGFVDKTNNMTLYHSVMDTNSSTGDNLGNILGNVAPQLPNVADTSTDVTHNVFFNYPDKDDLPGALKPTAIAPAIASEFSFMGADGTNLTAKYSEGGAFTFNSDKQGSYKLIIDTNKDGNYDPTTDRVIENVAVKGKNTVVWDGKDAGGNSLPIGAYKAKLTMKGGEYHFPVLDAEYNPFGIKIELLNPPSAFQSGVNKNTVYYNESDYKTANTTPVNLNAAASGNGINPINALGGVDSSNGAHKYWYSSSSSSGGYGNWKGIDTWTYFPGNSITLDFNVAAAGTPANGFVTGYIFNDKDKSADFDSGEPGLSGVTVKVTDKNGAVHTTTTDNSGYYAINIPQGNYNLVVNPPTGYTLTTSNASQSGTLSSSNQIMSNIGYYVATDVAIVSTASPTQTVLGHEVVYALTITNNGLVTATNVVVNDALPAGITYVSDNSGGLYDSNTGNLNIGNLAAGESKTISIVGNINSNLTLPVSITNVATVSLTEPDTNAANNKSTVAISPKANSLPTITNTTFAGNNDSDITGNLNGKDADGDTITYSLPAQPGKGTITINPDGTFTYTPKPGATGTDSFPVTLNDGHGGTSTVTVSVRLNSQPVLNDVSTKTDFNKPISSKITGTDADGNTLTYSKASEPGKGTAVVNSDGTFTYTPNTGATGTDSFTVRVTDGNGGSKTANITVVIDTPPTAGNLNITADFNKPISDKVDGTDVDKDTLTYAAGTAPSKGKVTVNSDGTFTYTPNDGATGDDSFTVVVSDGHGGNAVSTVSVKIDTPPTVVAGDINAGTDFNKPVSGKVDATDADDDTLAYTVGTAPSKGKVTVDENGNWAYTPDTGAIGADSFTIVVSDGHGGSVTKTINVKIDTPPTVAAGGSDVKADFNKPVSGKIDATDADKDTLTYSVGTVPSKGKVELGADGTFTYTPNTGATGTDSFTVVVSDGHGGSVEKTINVKIDTPPTVVNYNANANFNEPVSGIVMGTDVDKDALTYSVGTGPNKGKVSVNADGTWTYTPNTGATGDDSFTVVVSDGHGGSVTSTVSVKIDTPPTVEAGTINAKADFNKPVSGKIDATDADKDALTYAVGTTPSKGKVELGADGTWTYTPNTGAIGTDSFTVVVSDGHGGSVISTINVKIDTPPTASDINTTTDFNKPVTGKVEGADADKDTLAYTVGITPSKGKVDLGADGAWTYTPNTGATGIDSFTVVVSDGHGGSVISTISVKIDTPPTVEAGTINAKADFNKPVSGKIDATDADKDALTYAVGTTPSKGKVELGADGTWTYTPNTGATGTDSFTVVVSDGNGGSVTSTINVKIDTPPTTSDINTSTDFNKPVTGKVEGADVDKDTLAYSVGTGPSKGKVDLGADGTWTYTPNTGATGDDSFTVVVNDGHGGSVTSTVNVKIDTPPTATDINTSTDFNKPVTGKVEGADVDKDALSYVVGTAPSKGKVELGADGTWTYTPNTGATGTDSFTVVVSDGHGGSVTSTINVKIDTPPTASDINTITDFNKPVTGKVAGADVDKDALTYVVGTAPSKGKVELGADGTWTYTPNTGAVGTDSFTVVVNDGHGGSVISTVNVKIDTPPTASDINTTTDFNKPITGKVEGTDVDKDTLTYTVGTAPSKGKVELGADGAWTYTPNTGATGTDSFTVVVNDGHGGTAVSTVKIIIDTPPAVPSYNRVTPYNQSVTGIVAANDVDNDSLNYTLISKPSNGYVELDKSGRWTYTPNLNYAGTDSFKVSVNDGHGGSTISEINITVKDKVNLVGTITDEETGRIIPNTKVDLYDLRGKLIYSTTTDANGNYSINNVKLGLYEFIVANEKYAKKTVDIDVEPASETEYTIRKDFKLVNSLSYTLKLDANPRTIIGDGKSTSVISARITDKNNNPVANALVVFTAPIGTFPNGTTAITDSNGVARVLFQSAKISGTENKVIPVTATVNDNARNLHASDQIFMTFEPGMITGVVIDNETGLPVSNAVVEVSKDFDGDGIADFYSKMITGADGKYSIAIPKGNAEYNVSITKPVTIGGKTVEVKYNQKSQAGTITGVGGESFASEETAAGVILAKQPNGTALFFDDYSKFNIDVLSQADFSDVLNGKAKLNSISGISASIGNGSLDKGVFEAEGLEKGKSYVLALSYTLPSGEKLIVGSVNVCVNADGQINISSALIDPYGTITDAVTKGIISGADVKLYYADTARNRAAGRNPNTLVKLPLISGFEPADNNNPQIDDINGKYAFMVFPNADYYIVVSKEGYETYTSETISVGSTIVKKDIEMIAKAKAAANTNSTTKISTTLPKTGSPIDLNSLGILGTVILLSGIGLSLKPKKKDK